VSQAAPVVQLASLGQASASVQVAQLSVAQMSEVQGDGLWKKFKKWLKKVVKKVIGVIINEIIEVIRDWLEEIFGVAQDGGEKQEATDVQTKDYASQADYDVDNAYSDQTQTNEWQQTEMWYGAGDGGGGCSGTYEQEREQRMYYEIQPSC
jgi:hypothetical protein